VPRSSSNAPTEAQRRQALDFAEIGRRSAIRGDRAVAIEQLRQAAALDPTNADVVYELARDYETTGDSTSAANAYCRFLAIAPDAPEAAEARDRVAVLAPARHVAPSSQAATLFAAAVTAYDQARMTEAEGTFGGVINAEPTWADAYYDRALARIGIGSRLPAAGDLEAYLQLKPQAEDRTQVAAWIQSLRRRPPSARTALQLGLLIPGGGQIYTGRPVRGIAVLGGAAVAMGFGLARHTRMTSVQQTTTDPFGSTYTYTVDRRTTHRPNLVTGVAIAGSLAVMSAVEAFRYAARRP
jgi:Flp pilus assembly protein TadD